MYKQTIVGCCHPELMFDIRNTIRMVRTPNIFIHGSESCLFSQGITVVHPSSRCLIVQVSNCLVSNCPVSNCPFTVWNTYILPIHHYGNESTLLVQHTDNRGPSYHPKLDL